MSTIKERITEFIESKGISVNAFETSVGLSKSYMAKVKGSLGSDILEKILTTYPEINCMWLIKGEGEMFRTDSPPDDEAIHREDGHTIVGGHVSGNGNNISHNDHDNISGMIDLQKGYQDLLKKSQEQIDRLIGIIEKGGKDDS